MISGLDMLPCIYSPAGTFPFPVSINPSNPEVLRKGGTMLPPEWGGYRSLQGLGDEKDGNHECDDKAITVLSLNLG